MTLLLDVDLPEGRRDVRMGRGLVTEVGDLSPAAGERVLLGLGGALLPGLHDHHIHLLATAAAADSVDVSHGLEPLAVPGDGWLRAVGWASDGDRHLLDAVQARRPVRVQHRGGSLWVLNSAALDMLGIDQATHPGIERGDDGRPTGRLWRADDLLREVAGRQVPDLAGLGARLARLGVTGVTDATPGLDLATARLLRASVHQKLLLLGDSGPGPTKVVLGDHDLPTYPALVSRLQALRPRPVAVHCVTRDSLVLLLAALETVGTVAGDRVEHAAVIPPELLGRLPAVVTQPGFVSTHGDRYLEEVSDEEHANLYRYGSVASAGGVVVPSSDAPYGPLDPWQIMVAARDRRAPSGAVLNPTERVPVGVALAGMLKPLDDLRAAARAVVPGQPADLVLLHVPRLEAIAHPHADHVRSTWIDGHLAYSEDS